MTQFLCFYVKSLGRHLLQSSKNGCRGAKLIAVVRCPSVPVTKWRNLTPTLQSDQLQHSVTCFYARCSLKGTFGFSDVRYPSSDGTCPLYKLRREKINTHANELYTFEKDIDKEGNQPDLSSVIRAHENLPNRQKRIFLFDDFDCNFLI
ncbi:Hypothetical predicted protein [Scomber scombrus]|uniref:Uncharacterized protein n=1 Tax=Scomber scombrus TaxID=13677 RepID=A0AAV1P2Y2_SCOSC